MVIFTIPYLTTQAIGAGIMIQNMTAISWQVGAAVTMVAIMFYVLSCGIKATALTDVIQVIIMILALVLAVVFIAISLVGFEVANTAPFNAKPELFTRPGGY